ncbi:hypothetical protein EDD21DRAFT_177428 [Dissophora ornata]|nr:hypothetical protein EDD21DRAFT_177428 [Dissophora ornata]
MSLAILALTAVMVMTSLAFLTNMITQKLGTLKDPLQVWEVLHGVDLLPPRLRAWIFSTIVGYTNPYARTINFRITELRKGKACGVLKETKTISNPFRSVHAAALVTFGETVGSLALFTLLGKKDRAILTNISAEVIIFPRQNLQHVFFFFFPPFISLFNVG